MRTLLGFMLFLILCGTADAVLLASNSTNDAAPSDDPGWARFGTRTGTNASGAALHGLTHIYIGNGWVLTANHVGVSDFKLAGQIYPKVLGSGVQLQNPDGSAADLLTFRIEGNPDLPALGILEFARVSPAVNTPVTMIGRGALRGAATTWNQPPLRSGWFWTGTAGMRWGTNVISATLDESQTGTAALVMEFTKPGDPSFTADEAQAVTGDSGGGVFVKNAGNWELAGVLFAAGYHVGQQSGTAFDGNLSYAADLALFRQQLVALVRPQCSDEVDNNQDGLTDYPEDPSCLSPEDDQEVTPVPATSQLGITALCLLCMGAGVTYLRGLKPSRTSLVAIRGPLQR